MTYLYLTIIFKPPIACMLFAGADSGGGRTRRAPLKLERIWFFGVTSWFFTRNTPKKFAPPSARRNLFKCAPLAWNPCLIRVMVFLTPVSTIFQLYRAWWSVLLMEETGVHRDNYRPVESHWQTLSHNVVSSTSRHEQDSKLVCVVD